MSSVASLVLRSCVVVFAAAALVASANASTVATANPGWQRQADLPTGQAFPAQTPQRIGDRSFLAFATAVVNGRLVVLGGSPGNDVPLAQIDIDDPATLFVASRTGVFAI